MEIQNLPEEIQNKVFFFVAEHPCAKMIKNSYSNRSFYHMTVYVDHHGDSYDHMRLLMVMRDDPEYYEARPKHLSHPKYCRRCESCCSDLGCPKKTIRRVSV